MKFKRLINLSSVSQSIVYQGNRIVLKPHIEETFELELANEILERCQGVIREIDDDIGGISEEKPQKKIWVANITGNTETQAKVLTRQFVNRHWQETEIDNPYHKPMLLSETYRGGMKLYTDKNGLPAALNLDSIIYEILPYKRKEFPEHIGNWFLNRASNTGLRVIGEYYPVKAIMSRPPSAFEPSVSWSYDEIVAYFLLLDPDAIPPRSELELRKDFGRKKVDAEKLDIRLEDEKRSLLKRTFFRVVDPKYRLPTKVEFDEFYRGKNTKEEREKEATNIINKSLEESKKFLEQQESAV